MNKYENKGYSQYKKIMEFWKENKQYKCVQVLTPMQLVHTNIKCHCT